ncbi:hypothetical protein [Prochlorococcus marinus]|uniref:hypothetical protein n=1 Tax=Prochlorococcus marinus TaxID=1219 RepID=UPI0022B4F91F|nr:hypothetical protein [Prochlorococcus marinus]
MKNTDHRFTEFIPFTTKDGTLTLKSKQFKESFHSSTGALKEAKEKFIQPSELDRFEHKKHLTVLDVCVGMGYNTACLLDELQKKKTYILTGGD